MTGMLGVLLFFFFLSCSTIPNSSSLELLSANLRKQTLFTYNTADYPFGDLVLSTLKRIAGRELSSFEKFHKDDFSAQIFYDGRRNGMNILQAYWNRDRARPEDSTNIYEDIDDLYTQFIRKEIGPLLGGGRIVYQRVPTLRVSVPWNQATTALHNDRDYHHQPSELNYWLPLTEAYGNNSLWVESEPYKDDFKPLTMQYGQYCRFFGNLCRHFTNPNDTNSTRVSLDFRVVSTLSGGHDGSFRKGVRRGAKAKFQTAFDIGGFYSECMSE